MTCNEYQELIPEYLEKALTVDIERELRFHLNACGECRKELAQARALIDAARTIPRQQPAAETVLKISEAIHQSTPPPRRGEFGPVLDVDDLAEYLRVDKIMLELYLDELPHFELGGKLLFRRKSVDQWIEERERVAALQTNMFAENETIRNL